MDNIRQIENRICDLNSAAEAITDMAEAEGRDLSRDESREIERILNEAKPLCRMLEQSEDSASLAETRSVGRRSEPNGFGGRDIEPTRYVDQSPVRAIRNVRNYVDLFGSADLRDNGGFKNFEQFASVIARGMFHPNLQPFAAADFHESGVGVDGGFAVPPAFRAGLLDETIASSVILPRAQVIAMNGPTVNAPGWDTSNENSPGGFVGEWTAEGQIRTSQVGVMRQVALTAHKYLIYADASSEILQDASPSFSGQLQRVIGQALAFGLDTAFVNGTGVAQPLGILSSPSLITVAPIAAQGDTVLLENVLALYSRMYPSSITDAVWLVNGSVIPQLFALHQEFFEGAAVVVGALSPVFTQNGDDCRLLGRPVVVTSRCPALGDAVI